MSANNSEDIKKNIPTKDKPKKVGLTYDEWKEKRKELFEDQMRTEEKSLESSKQTLGLILESERIGVKTGRELVRQRETLNRVEDKLVVINGHLDESQRHLKSMKSVFNSFKGYFSKKPNANKPSDENIINEFFEEKNEFQFKAEKELNESEVKNAFNGDSHSSDSAFLDTDAKSGDNSYWNKSIEVNDKIEQNLNEIDFGVERLKQLSLNLGNEIDLQNTLIDRITKDSEKTEIRIVQQNNDMKKILRK